MIRKHQGFTLIELMIVIAIIAIVAAIAIPGLLLAQRSANERNASTSLKTIATAEYDFRSNDREANKVNDFWTANVAGLYLIQPGDDQAASFGASIKLIDISIAAADVNTTAVIEAIGIQQLANTWSYQIPANQMPSRGPKSGYWYYALSTDDGDVAGEVYQVNTDQTAAYHNSGKFGFGAFPDSYGLARSVFIINESATIIRLQLPTNYTRPGGSAYPPAAPLVGDTFMVRTLDLMTYPSPTNASKFSRIDN